MVAEGQGSLADVPVTFPAVEDRVIKNGEPRPDIERAMTESGLGGLPVAETAVEEERFGLFLLWRCDCGTFQREVRDWIYSRLSPTEAYYETARESIRGKWGGLWEKILRAGAGVECECGVLGCPV